MHAVLRSFAAERGEVVPPHIDMDLIRRACWDETSLRIVYRDAADRVTDREVWPLGISYSDSSLLLAAMCRLRGDFRMFHVPRMISVVAGVESFRPHRVALLREFAASRGARPVPVADSPPGDCA